MKCLSYVDRATNFCIPANNSCLDNYIERFAPGLRDVLPEIFENLLVDNHGHSLRSAILVCRAWAAVGITLLWRSVNASSLERIPTASRRQFYAAKVQTLHAGRRLHSSGTPVKATDDLLHRLRFPRLRRLTFTPWSTWGTLMGNVAIGPFIQPRLEMLECEIAALADDSVVQRLADECRQLSELSLTNLCCCRRYTVHNGMIFDVWPRNPTPAKEVVYDDCRRLLEVLALLPKVDREPDSAGAPPTYMLI